MKKINVDKVIKDSGIDFMVFANQLFPSHKHPRLALNRVISGELLLNEQQISKLSLLSGRSIAQLYSEEQWNSVTKGDLIHFNRGNYLAILDRGTWVTKIYHNESLFHESIIHSGSTPLSEYLHQLELIIIKFEYNE